MRNQWYIWNMQLSGKALIKFMVGLLLRLSNKKVYIKNSINIWYFQISVKIVLRLLDQLIHESQYILILTH